MDQRRVDIEMIYNILITYKLLNNTHLLLARCLLVVTLLTLVWFGSLVDLGAVPSVL